MAKIKLSNPSSHCVLLKTTSSYPKASWKATINSDNFQMLKPHVFQIYFREFIICIPAFILTNNEIDLKQSLNFKESNFYQIDRYYMNGSIISSRIRQKMYWKATIELLFYMNRHTKKLRIEREKMRKICCYAYHVNRKQQETQNRKKRNKIGSKVDGECRWNSLHPFWLKRIHS